jgi:hypothetical protein
MIPMERLSTTVVSAPYKAPDDIETASLLIEREMGGVGLNDSSQGHLVQVWTSYYNTLTEEVFIGAGSSPFEVFFTGAGISELSFCFDQNMRPFHTYVQNGQAKFRWYDSLLGGFAITDLNAADYSPRCTLDDKRERQITVGFTDIILAYMRADALYYRMQRDRYEVEYLLKENVGGRLLRVGMNEVNRLQFLIEEVT